MNILNEINNNIFNYFIRGRDYIKELNMRLLDSYLDIIKSLGLQIHVSASDNANVNSNASYVANVGGNYNNDAANDGPFYVSVNNNASNTNNNIGARLVAAYPYSGQYSYRTSNRILRLFTGFITSIITSKISSKVIRYRSQCICYALAKVNGKILLTKGWVSSSLNKIVEDLLESNRGYLYNNPYLSSVYGKFTSERGGSITL